MELISLEIHAVDYVEESRKEELERALKDISGRGDIPRWLSQWGFPGPFFNTQDWGDIKARNLSEFERVKVHVLLCKDLRFAYMVIISGQVSKNLIAGISKGEIKIQDIRKKFEAQARTIFDKIGGIVSRSKAHIGASSGSIISIVDAKRNEEAVLAGYPSGIISLIVASFGCEDVKKIGMPSELGRKMLESRISGTDIEQLNRLIREEDVFRNIGINFGGIISVASLANNYVSFISQCNAVWDNFGYSHEGYAVIGLGGNIQLSEHVIGFPTLSLGLSHQLRRLAVLQMLVFWIRSKLIRCGELRERMKELQTKALESEWKAVSKVHEELWRSESEFLKEYTFVLDAMKYVQSYTKFERGLQRDQFHKEIALPTESLVSSETGKPLALGVFDVITGDIEGGSVRAKDLYSLLKEQYSLVSDYLRDRININLATSNIMLQKWLVGFTFILVILTIVLLLQGFGWFK